MSRSGFGSRGGASAYERLIKQQCQKGASANKSSGVVSGKWGSSSYTSIRAGAGQSGGASKTAASASANHEPAATYSVPKPKKFFKSRAVDQEIRTEEELPEVSPIHATSTSNSTIGQKRPAPSHSQPQAASSKPAGGGGGRRNKFFTSKQPKLELPPPPPPEPIEEEEEEEEEEDVEEEEEEEVEEEPALKVPPLKLRIKPPPASSKSKGQQQQHHHHLSQASGKPQQYKLVRSDTSESDQSQDSASVSPSPAPSEEELGNENENIHPGNVLLEELAAAAAAAAGAADNDEAKKPTTTTRKTYARKGAGATAANAAAPTCARKGAAAAPAAPAAPAVRPVRSYSRRTTRNAAAATAASGPPPPAEVVQPELETEVVAAEFEPVEPVAEVPESQPDTALIPIKEEEGEQEEASTASEAEDEATTTLPATSRVPDVEAKSFEVEDDPEISFKDESIVISPSRVGSDIDNNSTAKNSLPPANPPASSALLQKAATVASGCGLEKELLGGDLSGLNDCPAKADSQPIESTSTSTSLTSSTSMTSSTAAAPGVGRERLTKKRSIFTSRSRDTSTKKNLYKHDWHASSTDRDEFKREVLTRAVFGGVPKKSTSCLDFPDDDFDDLSSAPGGAPAPFTSSSSASSSSLATSTAPPSEMTLTRVPTAPSTSPGPLDLDAGEVVSVKCPKEHKSYYTVIKNVKKAHQIQDSGEFQEFNDDVDYILEGLGAKNSLSTRCLSTVTLASKCMEPGFRMHLRAHGTVTQFFSELRDAPANPSLALCSATVLFVLSQDRLNMDLDRDSLELMLNLLDTDSRIKDALEGAGMNRRELEKNKQKVEELVTAMKAKGHGAVNLSLEHITADHLAMETLLSLTSKRAGEWFKEELRELGGLDHLVNTMSDCVDFLTADEITMWTEPLHNKLKKADRVLKVLENVTHENEENCTYLLRYKDGQFLSQIHKMFKMLDEEVPLNPSLDASIDKDSVAASLRDALFDVIRVYINLVHDYHQQCLGSQLSGEKEDMLDICLHCLFVLPESIPESKRFDILVLTLTLMINLVENCVQNRELLIKSRVPAKADCFLAPNDREMAPLGMIRLFLDKEEDARREESKTDNILDGVKVEDEENDDEETERKKTQEERIDETVAKLLHKAGRHMEDTLIASYITLIVGYLIIDDKENEAMFRELLPDQKFEVMVAVLKKFFNFMNLTASSTVTSSRGIKATEMIIKHLEKIDKPEDEEKKKTVKEEEEDNMDDISLFDVSKDDTTFMEDDPDASDRADFTTDDFGKL